MVSLIPHSRGNLTVNLGCGLLLFAFNWTANWNVLLIVAFRHSLFFQQCRTCLLRHCTNSLASAFLNADVSEFLPCFKDFLDVHFYCTRINIGRWSFMRANWVLQSFKKEFRGNTHTVMATWHDDLARLYRTLWLRCLSSFVYYSIVGKGDNYVLISYCKATGRSV